MFVQKRIKNVTIQAQCLVHALLVFIHIRLQNDYIDVYMCECMCFMFVRTLCLRVCDSVCVLYQTY